MAAGIPRDQWGLPEPPEALLYIWEYFAKISNTRQQGMGFSPITNLEVESFCRLRKILLEPWEVDLLFELDNAVRSVYK